MPNSDCIVLVPVASAIEPATHDCLSALIDRGYRVQTLRGCSQVDLARSSLASDALLRGDWSELMWIDSDMVFRPDDVERLRSHNRPITCGLYMKKDRSGFAARFQEGTKKVMIGADGGLLEIDYAGFGFMHTRREVFERIESRFGLPRCTGGYDPAKEIVPYFVPMVTPRHGRWEYLSEDASFCQRARECNYKVMADTTIKCGHMGKHCFDWDDLVPRQTYEGFEIAISGNQ